MIKFTKITTEDFDDSEIFSGCALDDCTITISNNNVEVTYPDGSYGEDTSLVAAYLEAKVMHLEKVAEEKAKNKIKVGDLVKIVDNLHSYTAYCDWLIRNDVDAELMCQYQLRNYPDEDNTTYVVERIAPWSEDGGELLYLIRSNEYHPVLSRVYLMGIEGLEKVVG